MEGALHFRAFGQVHGIAEADRYRPDMPTPAHEGRPGRVLVGHIMPWGSPVEITPRKGPRYLESFEVGSLRMIGEPPAVSVGHLSEGGTRIGRVARIWSSAGAWCDAALLVDEGPQGDAALDGIGGDGGRLPLSIAFQPLDGGSITYPPRWPNTLPEVRRTRVRLLEVSIVEHPAYESAHTYARMTLAAAAALADARPK